MQPTTPTGSFTTRLLPTVDSYSNDSASAPAVLNELIGSPAWTIWLSHFGMPASRVTIVAISSMRAVRPSPMRVQNLPPSSGDVCDQESNAARAALAALSTSSAVPSGIVPITEPSVESNTSIVPLPFDGTHAPSMYSLSWTCKTGPPPGESLDSLVKGEANAPSPLVSPRHGRGFDRHQCRSGESLGSRHRRDEHGPV